MANLVSRPRRHHHVQPLAARRLIRAGEDAHDVAIFQRRAQWNQFAVHARADAAMSDVGMNAIREVERRRAARKCEHVALRRERVHLVGIEIDLQRVEKDVRIFDLVLPLHELTQPKKTLVVRMRADASFLVLPVRGDALLRDEVHLFRADLHFERLSFLRDDRRMQRLIEVRLRHGDVVLDSSRDRSPHLMNDAEACVAVFE